MLRKQFVPVEINKNFKTGGISAGLFDGKEVEDVDAIITAIISGAVTLIVCLVNNYFQRSRSKEENDKTVALIDYRLTELTDKVNRHNNLIERTYNLEKLAVLLDEKLKVANHRIADLEQEDE